MNISFSSVDYNVKQSSNGERCKWDENRRT
jgi:hypothetical protein